MQEVRDAVRNQLVREGLDVPDGLTALETLDWLEGRSFKSEGVALLEALACVELSAKAWRGIREQFVGQLDETAPVVDRLHSWLCANRDRIERYLRTAEAVERVATPEGPTAIAFGEEKIAPNSAELRSRVEALYFHAEGFAGAVRDVRRLLEERRPDELIAAVNLDESWGRTAWLAHLAAMGMAPTRLAEHLGWAPMGVDRKDRAHAHLRYQGGKKVQDHLRHFSRKLQNKTRVNKMA